MQPETLTGQYSTDAGSISSGSATFSRRLLVFTLDDQHCALRLSSVERVIHAVEITHLPDAPEIVLGIINVHGRVVPVLNVRRRFGLPDRELQLSDHFIIAATSRRTVALAVDTVIGLMESTEEETAGMENVMTGSSFIEGIMKTEAGLVLVYDLELFLSIEEQRRIHEAIEMKQEV